MATSSKAAAGSARTLSSFERGCVEVFVHAAQVLSVPRSVGEIFGLLYASSVPLSMDDIITRLDISKGSASQGLRWLRDVNAVRATYVTGDRRDHFVAETELRRLAFGFLREKIEPHLQRGIGHLDRLDDELREIPAGATRKFAEARAKKLRRWHRFATQIFPVFLRIAGKF